MGSSFLPSGQTPIVVPRGLQGLSPKGGIGVLGYPSLHATHPFPLVFPSTIMGHIPLPLPCMCSPGFHPHIQGFIPTSGVLSPPEVLSSPSVVHDHTFIAVHGGL